jgi:hypothetical protein
MGVAGDDNKHAVRGSSSRGTWNKCGCKEIKWGGFYLCKKNDKIHAFVCYTQNSVNLSIFLPHCTNNISNQQISCINNPLSL